MFIGRRSAGQENCPDDNKNVAIKAVKLQKQSLKTMCYLIVRASLPGYDRDMATIGITPPGPGAFPRGQQAVITGEVPAVDGRLAGFA